jgi:hypothetical protein
MKLVFTLADEVLACQAARLGVSEFLFDYENVDFPDRSHREAHFQRLSSSLRSINSLSRMIIRVPKCNYRFLDYVGWAFHQGADEVLVPGLETLAQVQSLFSVTDSSSRISLVVETRTLLSQLHELPHQFCYRYHFGLIDLSRELGFSTPLELISNPLLEHSIRSLGPKALFGFLSVAPPCLALPLNSGSILKYMKSVGVGYAFLGKSFRQAVNIYGLEKSLSDLNAAIGPQ